MQEFKNKLPEHIWRFMLVGAIATLIDFSVLFTLHELGLQSVVANVISTFLSFCFSFFANKHYTFHTTGANLQREITLFVVITLFGVWVLQTIAIVSVTPLFSHVLTGTYLLFGAKLVATGVSLTWNAILYPRVVFKKTPAQ